MKITDKYVLFWGEYPSQWYIVDMVINGVTYNCCEQYMMHQKALLFDDKKIAAEIMKTSDPRQQKALGRQVKNFNEKVWNMNCLRIVYDGNYAKFTQNEDLKQLLLSTGNRIYVEASPEDSIWGIGLAEYMKDANNPNKWGGTNLLGFAITLVKHELMVEQK